ncbi:MAG TPA: hypothetical protein VIT45_04995 [Allosphingosinicella sp.]
MSENIQNDDAKSLEQFSGQWLAQIGPGLTADVSGSIYGTESAFFVVLPAGDPSQTYAQYSLDAGNTWTGFPNFQGFGLAPQGNSIQWRILSSFGEVKFLIGPGQ